MRVKKRQKKKKKKEERNFSLRRVLRRTANGLSVIFGGSNNFIISCAALKRYVFIFCGSQKKPVVRKTFLQHLSAAHNICLASVDFLTTCLLIHSAVSKKKNHCKSPQRGPIARNIQMAPDK
jgi:hypothetical protein